MANRYGRDELIELALEEADVPTLKQHDAPNGIVLPQAHMIRWLQLGLDYWHKTLPWASRIVTTSIQITPANLITAPSDFILDIRDGIVVSTGSTRRLKRVSYQRALSLKTYTGAQDPIAYTVQGNTITFAPVPSQTLDATLHYYQLPADLGALDKPDFPDDDCLIEFLKLRAWEWTRALQPGTSKAYARDQVAKLQEAGLGNEPEFEEIPFDSWHFSGAVTDPNAWMGSTTF